VCRYSWHSAGSLGGAFPMIKYKYIFQVKYTEAILSNSTRKLLRFELLFIIIFGTLSFPRGEAYRTPRRRQLTASRNKPPKHLRSQNIGRRQFVGELKTVLFARACASQSPLRTLVYKTVYIHLYSRFSLKQKKTYTQTYNKRNRKETQKYLSNLTDN